MVIYMLREEAFQYPLDSEGKHFVRICKRFGALGLEDFVVVYFVAENGKNVPLVTYDLAHGFAHRDLRFLDAGNGERKVALDGPDLWGIFENVVADIHGNWGKYFEKYLLEKRRGLDESK